MILFSRKGFAFLFGLLITTSILSQDSEKVEIVYGKVIQVDKVDAISIFDNTFIGGYKYLHGIIHFKVVTYQSDTLVLGVIFNIRRDKDSVLNTMGIKVGKPYKFFSASCMPCNSNFPSMYGCEDMMLHPGKNSMIKSPYFSILRVFDFVTINETQWNALKKSAQVSD